MKIVFLSNYFNHHQKPFSDEMYRLLGEDYIFIETKRMPKSRVKLGYDSEVVAPYVIPVEYTVTFFDNVVGMINDADVVIAGEADYKYIAERKKQKKIIIKYLVQKYMIGDQPISFSTIAKNYLILIFTIRNFMKKIILRLLILH